VIRQSGGVEAGMAWGARPVGAGRRAPGDDGPGACQALGAASGGEALAALEPSGPDHRLTGAVRHPMAEAMALGPAAVVGLERALHCVLADLWMTRDARASGARAIDRALRRAGAPARAQCSGNARAGTAPGATSPAAGAVTTAARADGGPRTRPDLGRCKVPDGPLSTGPAPVLRCPDRDGGAGVQQLPCPRPPSRITDRQGATGAVRLRRRCRRPFSTECGRPCGRPIRRQSCR